MKPKNYGLPGMVGEGDEPSRELPSLKKAARAWEKSDII
jgi:hypothetical protein